MKALEYCHKNHIIHRDLKPHNIFVSEDLQRIKIGDFGVSRFTNVPMKAYTQDIITLWYRPPEILLQSRKYSSEVDLWSIGCIIAELLLLKPLYQGKNEEDQLNRIFEVNGLPTVEEWPEMEELTGWDKIDLKLGQDGL